MYTIKCSYLGDLKTESLYLPSGISVLNEGVRLGEDQEQNHFSPTDLVCASLGNSILTHMARKAIYMDVILNGLEAEVEKTMSPNPLKISGISITVKLKETDANGEQLNHIKEAGLNCPVALSLHPNLNKNIHFNF